jgi:hypothetical protein
VKPLVQTQNSKKKKKKKKNNNNNNNEFRRHTLEKKKGKILGKKNKNRAGNAQVCMRAKYLANT